MEELNDTLREDFEWGMFVTAAIAVFAPGGDSVRIVRAGHCPLGLVRAGEGRLEWLLPEGVALGITVDEGGGLGAELVEIGLQPGDGLLLYTDGVTEAHGPKREEYGEERVKAFAERNSSATPNELVRRLVADLQAFAGKAEQHDDMTIVYARRRASDAPPRAGPRLGTPPPPDLRGPGHADLHESR